MKNTTILNLLIIIVMLFSVPAVSYADAANKPILIAKLFNTNTDPDKAHWDLATDYAKKGLFKFAIIEFNKISPGYSQYLDAIQSAGFLALKLQEQDYEKNHYTKPVDGSPLLFTSSLFSARTGALEDFIPGSNSASIQVELYSISNTPVTSITFKIFCFDTMLEPVGKDKGIYVTTVDKLDIKPYSFYTTAISLDSMGKVNDAKIAIMEVTFADGTNWVSPLQNSDVKQDKEIKKDNMPKHF